MATSRERLSNINLQATIGKILAQGKLTRQEYFYLSTAMLSDRKVTYEERSQINRVLDKLLVGDLKLSD